MSNTMLPRTCRMLILDFDNYSADYEETERQLDDAIRERTQAQQDLTDFMNSTGFSWYTTAAEGNQELIDKYNELASKVDSAQRTQDQLNTAHADMVLSWKRRRNN